MLGPGSWPDKYLRRAYVPLQPSQTERDTIEIALKINKRSFSDGQALQEMNRAG